MSLLGPRSDMVWVSKVKVRVRVQQYGVGSSRTSKVGPYTKFEPFGVIPFWVMLRILVRKMHLLTSWPWPLTFQPDGHVTSRTSQDHSLYQVWTLWDHSFLTCISHTAHVNYRLDVCLSVIRWYCVETAQPIVKLSSLPGSPMILVFWGPNFFPEF